jgi:hypothetical protein
MKLTIVDTLAYIVIASFYLIIVMTFVLISFLFFYSDFTGLFHVLATTLKIYLHLISLVIGIKNEKYLFSQYVI